MGGVGPAQALYGTKIVPITMGIDLFLRGSPISKFRDGFARDCPLQQRVSSEPVRRLNTLRT